MVWRYSARLRQAARDGPAEIQWVGLLGSMVQVSLVGYAVGGAFLDLAFWDLPYYLFAAVAAARYLTLQSARAALAMPSGRRPEQGAFKGVATAGPSP